MQRSTLATLAIVVITAIWGSTFFVIKDAVSLIDPVDFLAVRFAIGSLIPALIFLPRLRRLTGRQWLTGLGIGAIYGAGQIVQTIGLQTTAASVSGFITGTYVVITPLVVWLAFRARPGRGVWLAVALAVAGLGVLSLNGVTGFGLGEWLTLAGAALYAVHIVVLDRHATSMDPVSLAVVQLIGVAVVCGVGGAPGGYQVPAVGSVWVAIGYTAILAGIVTMALQTWAQRHIPPTRTALLMTLEPVFASAFAVAFGGEHVTLRLILGGALILLATLVGVRGNESAEPLPERPPA